MMAKTTTNNADDQHELVVDLQRIPAMGVTGRGNSTNNQPGKAPAQQAAARAAACANILRVLSTHPPLD